MKIKHLTAVALAFGLPLVGAVAQQDGPPQNPPPEGANQGPPDGQPPQDGPGRGFRRPPPPIIRALDTNHDGVIDAAEIANAAAALKTRDKNGAGQLTVEELLGPPPRRGMGMGPGQGQGPQGPGGDQGPQGPGAGPDAGPPQGPPPDGTNGVAGNGMRGPGRGMRRLPPVIEALDANHDGIIDASEIANAPAALKSLDKNGVGYLTVPELLGPPRRGMGMGPGGGQGFGPGPGQGQGPDGGQGPQGPDGGQGPGPGAGPDGGPPPGAGPDGGQMPPPPNQQ